MKIVEDISGLNCKRTKTQSRKLVDSRMVVEALKFQLDTDRATHSDAQMLPFKERDFVEIAMPLLLCKPTVADKLSGATEDHKRLRDGAVDSLVVHRSILRIMSS